MQQRKGGKLSQSIRTFNVQNLLMNELTYRLKQQHVVITDLPIAFSGPLRQISTACLIGTHKGREHLTEYIGADGQVSCCK